MKTLFGGILVGLILGVLAVYSSVDRGEGERLIEDIGDARVFEPVEVERHRESRFSDLNSIESLQSLPGEFTRSEALYALCSRSSGDQLVRLAIDANRLADPSWRQRALEIILERLTQTKPQVALDLARSEAFRADLDNQATVLQTWAREDLVAAVSAISLFDDRSRSMSAQMIYSGVGGAYTEEAQIVEEALGIAPSRSNRERYVRGLAEVSPELALDHILGLDSKSHQHEQARIVAKLYAYKDIADAEQMAERIPGNELRREYLAVVYDQLARTEPMQAATKRLAIRSGGPLSDEETKAFAVIAKDDLDQALVLFDAETDHGNINKLGEIIAAVYAETDQESALEWARSTPDTVRFEMIQRVLVKAAENDPAFALQQASAGEQGNFRHTQAVVGKIVNDSPQQAANLISYIEQPSSREAAARQIAREWFKEEPFVALDWAMNSDEGIKAAVLRDPRVLRYVDTHEAQAMVNSLPAEHRGAWARNVADRLISEESPESAVQFVGQFAGQPDHDMQLAYVIAKVARDDGSLAMQWIDRLESGHARDGALSAIVLQEVQDDPANAVEWLEHIDDSDVKQTSAGSIAKTWLLTDPDAARRWLEQLPRGPERDNILVNATMNLYGQGDLATELIESVDDPDKRGQALLMQGMMNSRDDPAELIQLLDQMELPELFKQQIKSELLRGSVRGN